MKSLWMGLVLAGCFGAATAQAQVTFGIGAGLNYTSLGDVEFENRESVFESQSGYHIGAFIDMAAGPFAFRPGVYYMEAGTLFEGGLDPLGYSDVTDDFDVTFVAVPIDVRLRMPVPLIKPYVHFGPELHFLTGDDAPDTFREHLRSFTASGSVGAGLEIGLAGVRLMPEFRFAFDLSGLTEDTIEIGDTTIRLEEEYKSRSFMLRLGAAF